MSLYKKLWLGVIFLLTLVFIISVLLTTLSARAYLEEHLSIKNADNAAALALSMAEKGADEVLMELTLAAQFDTGHYELIELTAPDGRVPIRREADEAETGAPAWFTSLFPIRVEAGVASIQSGWQQAGTLTLRSHSRFAYEELWQNTLLLSGMFLLAGVVAGLVGNRLLKRILRPLEEVVGQAEAIGERRFVTNIPEPTTLEFRQVVRAMNELSSRVKSMLGQETKRLQKLQRESQLDEVTGLYNREPFLGGLEAALRSNDDKSSGVLCILRLTQLGTLNQSYGRKATDNLLRELGNAINRITMQHSGWSAARLNGSDFAVLAPREMDAPETGREFQEAMFAVLEDHGMREGVQIPGGTTVYTPQDTMGELLNRTDGVLIAAEREHVSSVAQAFKGDIPLRPMREQLEEWRGLLERAIRVRGFSLAQFPVVDPDQQLIHYESPVRLQWENKIWNAGEFLPWIHRLQLSGELDKQVFELALNEIERSGAPVAINLSVAAIADDTFRNWAAEPMTTRKASIANLWVEITESAVFRHLENFKRLAKRVKAHGGQVGIEHVGHQLAWLGSLHDVGLDYLKLDASFVRNIHDNPLNQTLLRTLCTVGHTIGVSVIAEGVNSDSEWTTLKELGIDGATGPGIRLDK
jgi:EAL domain-containing protein (putative c-di-GMP-specific phosphodiesterase class I)/GGDEF domain-containing protein